MTSTPGWEPRPGPRSGNPARPAPRGANGVPRDGGDPRRQAPRGGGAPQRDGFNNAGPSFTPGMPGRAPGGNAPRGGGSGAPGRGPGGPRGNAPSNGAPGNNGFGGPRGPRQGDGFDRSGAGRPVGGGRPIAGRDAVQFGRKAPAAGGLALGGLGRFLGGMSTWMAVAVIAGGALLGLIATVAVGQEPGTVLGVFIALAGIAAAFGIQRAKAYLLFPAPALAMFVAAIVAGKVHDAKLGSGTAATGIGLTQWIADMFLPGLAATVIVVLIGGGRWLVGRQIVTGGSSLLGGPSSARSNTARPSSALSGGPRPSDSRPPRRPPVNDPSVDDWASDAPFADQQAFKTSMMPIAGKPLTARPDNRTGGQRPSQGRDQRQDRDQWGEPRTGPRPRPNGGAPNGGRPNGGSAPRPSFNPGPQGPQGQRPPQRRQPPPDDWR